MVVVTVVVAEVVSKVLPRQACVLVCVCACVRVCVCACVQRSPLAARRFTLNAQRSTHLDKLHVLIREGDVGFATILLKLDCCLVRGLVATDHGARVPGYTLRSLRSEGVAWGPREWMRAGWGERGEWGREWGRWADG